MVLAVAALSVGTGSALADCTDPGEPGVNWQRCYFERQDLRDIRLNKAKLRDASFVRAVLTGADLSGADLTGARMRGADLHYAELTGATWVDGKKICAEGSIGRCL